MDSKSSRFPSPVERKSMWLQPSVAAGWSPGLLLVLDPACAICTCRWTMPPQWWCHEDARTLEGPTQEVHVPSCHLFVGLINWSGVLCWQRCIVLAPPPAQTDAACASRYVGGACSCFCLFRVPSLASWTAVIVKAPGGPRSALLCLSLLCNWAGDFGGPMWNLPFPAQLSNTKALEQQPVAIPETNIISTFTACFTSAKTRDWKQFLQ